MTKLVKNLIIGGSATTVLAGGGTGIALALRHKGGSKDNQPVVAISTQKTIQQAAKPLEQEKTVLQQRNKEIAEAQARFEKLKAELEKAESLEHLSKVEAQIAQWVADVNATSAMKSEQALANTEWKLGNEKQDKQHVVLENEMFNQLAQGNIHSYTTYTGFHKVITEPETKELDNQLAFSIQEALDHQHELDKENERLHQEAVDHKRQQDLDKIENHHETLHAEHEKNLEKRNAVEDKKAADLHSREVSALAHKLIVEANVKQVQEIISTQLTKAVEIHQANLENLAKVENEVKAWVDNQNNQHSKEISNQAHKLFELENAKAAISKMIADLAKLYVDREREIHLAFSKVPTVSISPDLLNKLISGPQTFTGSQINNLPLPKELITSLTNNFGVVKVEVVKNGNSLTYHLFDKNGIELTKDPIKTGMNVVNPRPELAHSVQILAGHQANSNQLAATRVTDTKLFIGSEIIAKFAQDVHANPATVVQGVIKEIESQIGGTEHQGEIYASATTTMNQLEVDTATAIDHNQAEEIARIIGEQQQEIRRFAESKHLTQQKQEELRNALDAAKQIFTMFAAKQKFDAIQNYASQHNNLLFVHSNGATLPTQYVDITGGNFATDNHLAAQLDFARVIHSVVQGQVWVRFEKTQSGAINAYFRFKQASVDFEFKIENIKINEVSPQQVQNMASGMKW